MPKQKITKEMVVEAAFELARSGGMDAVMVKNIAEKLGCSVQPIYSYCKNMDGLRQDVMRRTEQFMKEYLSANINPEDFFRSTGHAYIKLSKDEPNIFQMFVLHKRDAISSLEDLYQSETNSEVAGYIAEGLNISMEKAKMLHMNMLIYTVGIGTILATATPGISMDEILAQLEIAYQAFLKQALEA